MLYAVIMAGGVGTRFWPKSRSSNPKQFINLFGEESMIRQTVERLDGLVPPDRLMVVTNRDYVEKVKDQVPGIDPSNVIGEPVGRNTAPCIASAAALLHRRDPESVMLILPADHRITEIENFQSVIHTAVDTARKTDGLVTIGIEPNRPETGYGYIRREESPEEDHNGKPVYRVKEFTEKPNRERAEQFLKSGYHLWNSGMFIWKTGAILDAFQKYLPEIYKETETLRRGEADTQAIEKFYHACPSVSIDYGILEKAETVYVVPGAFDWNDVGSWRAVHELSRKDEKGNASIRSDSIFLEATGNLVWAESGKKVVLSGVDHLGVIETEDAILIVDLDKAQTVKKVVEQLRESGDSDHLL